MQSRRIPTRPERTRLGSVLSVLSALGLSTACGDDFASKSTLSDYRVLGVVAEPPEVPLSGQVSLSAFDFAPEGEDVSRNWSVCSYSFGQGVDYECLAPELERSLGEGSQVSLDLGPNGLDLESHLEQVRQLRSAEVEALDLESGFDLWVRLDSGPNCEGCRRVETIKRVRVQPNSGAARNTNPVISSFIVEGDLTAGSTVRLQVETEPPELFVDPVLGDELEEEYLYSWYTTVGETDPAVSFGENTESELTLPDESGDVEVFVAVRDGRGGVALQREVLEVR